MQTRGEGVSPGPLAEVWIAWPVYWSAIWVGALSSLAAALTFGLIGTVLGAHAVRSLSSWHTVSLLDLIAVVLACFFAFVVGGWVTGKVAGIRHSEPSILHATISWLVALPMLLVLMAAGAGSAFGGWYGGIIGSPLTVAAVAAAESPEAIRNTALAALTAVLISLIEAVITTVSAS